MIRFGSVPVLVLALACAGCSSGSGSNGHDASAGVSQGDAASTAQGLDGTVTDGAEQALAIAATFDPDPPVVGKNALLLQVSHPGGEPVVGAQITVDVEMPVHGHGSPDVPVVTEEGNGSYRAEPITFSMPGPWEITIDVTDPATGAVGHKVLSVDIGS